MWRPQGNLRIVIAVIAALVMAYMAWQKQQQHQAQPPAIQRPAEKQAPAATVDRETSNREASPEAPVKTGQASFPSKTTIRQQTIYDQSGKEIFSGDIDLRPTLARIKDNHQLRFQNDGSTFQNRERRLPKQPDGYYKEYVHPTPGLSGPGPQRIVMGKAGETYYTPDHYRTFQRVDGP